MIFKKYAFLSLALLTSMSKAFLGEDSCFKFYAGGDLGMGIFSIDNTQGKFTNSDNFLIEPIYYTNSKPLFIGGGRFGLAWTGSECWYAAIEGNVHSASKSGCTQGEFDADGNDSPDPQITFNDKTKFMAGVHFHLGYKASEDASIYGIVGYKYLRTDYSTTYASTTGRSFKTVNDCGCFNNNGWVAGLGALINLECNWDIRLEALYCSFGTKCGTDTVDFTTTVTNVATSDYLYRPRLFYGVVSVAYNF